MLFKKRFPILGPVPPHTHGHTYRYTSKFLNSYGTGVAQYSAFLLNSTFGALLKRRRPRRTTQELKKLTMLKVLDARIKRWESNFLN